MSWINILGDAAWIVALAFIAATLRQLSWRVDKATPLPLPWTIGLLERRRQPRNLVLLVMFINPFTVGVCLTIWGRLVADDALTALIFLGLKATTAGAFAMIHLTWLRGVARILLTEGKLKP